MTGHRPDDEPEPATTEPEVATRGLLGRLELAAVGALGLTVLVGSIAAVAQHWVPVSDDALIALHVGDVPAHLPLVGAWSRLGWSHPGPAQYYLLALPYRFSGNSPAALMITTLLVGVTGSLAAWAVARARSRTAGALVLLAMVLVMIGRNATDLRDPWNPYVGVLLTGTLVVLAWAAAQRRPVGAVALLPVGSLLVQAHVGYVPVVVSVVVAAVVGSTSPDPQRGVPWRWWLWGSVVSAVMWLPPVVQQITGDPGNLGELISGGAGDGGATGASTALRAVAAAFTLPPSWLGGSLPLGAEGMEPTWTVPVLLAIPVAALVLGIRRRHRDALLATAVPLTAVLGMTVGIARITGPLHEYLFAGLGATAAVSVALAGWVLVDRFGSPTVRSRTAIVALGLAAVLGVGVAWNQVGVQGPYVSTARSVAAVAPDVVEDARGTAVFIEAVPEFTAFAALPGFVLALENAGIDVTVPRGSEAEFGEHRVGDPGDRVRYLVAFPGMVDYYRSQGWTLIGSYDPLPAATSRRSARLDAEFLGLRRQLEAALEAGNDTDPITSLMDQNRQKAYELRAERFPIAVLRAP